MTPRALTHVGVVAFLAAALWTAPASLIAQRPDAAKPESPAKPWKVSRTADGQPDLQGFWTNTTYVPLERPKNVTKEFYTKEEVAENIKRAAATEEEQTEPGTVADVHYDFTQFGLDRSQGPLALNLRTSLIVDPPDGRIPPMTAEGLRRAAERAEARKRLGPSRRRTRPAAQRALHHHGSHRAADAGGRVQQQLSDRADAGLRDDSGRDDPRRAHHPARRPPAVAASVRQWTGSYRGRWEGDTLVVESTNFNGKNPFQGSSENLRLTERFTRVDENTIRYQFTIDDPSTWTRPWSAEVPWAKTDWPTLRARMSRRQLRPRQHSRRGESRGEARG